MSFILNSDGLDVVRRKLKDITDGMNPSTTSKWAKIIEKTANESYNNANTSPNPG